MNRYFFEVIYAGTAFHGSQLQEELATVQLALNKAMSTFFRKSILTYGASRTDVGVHANGNFYHIEIEEEIEAAWLFRFNSLLPDSIAIKSIYKCQEPFINARFDAISRSYIYKIYQKKNPFLKERAYFFPYQVNRALLDETAAIIFENTNFESFSKRRTNIKTYNCKIFESNWIFENDMLYYKVVGNRFLRGMVRALVGTQLLVAKGKISIAEFKRIIESNNCTKADFSAPGHGLYLEKIMYPEGKLVKIV